MRVGSADRRLLQNQFAGGLTRESENGDRLDLFNRQALEAARSRCHFLHQCGVLLGSLVHMLYSFTYLADTHALLCTGYADFPHDAGHSAYGLNHFAHGGSGLVY